MRQRHLFIIDPLEQLNFRLDSSLRIAAEFAALGDEVWATTPADMAWYSRQNGPECAAFPVRYEGYRAGSFRSVCKGQVATLALADFSGIHMRKEPPFDMNYIATTWLLDQAVDTVRIYNAPDVLRRFNEKAGILNYPEDTAPALISSDPARIIGFIRSGCAGDAIVKPLNMYGGEGIFRYQSADPRSESLLKQAVKDGARIIQPFDSSVFQGEVRVFTLGGKALCWCLKKPLEGSFLANTGTGARLYEFEPDRELEARVNRVASDLYHQGVALCGMDLIGGRISEINITSPRLLHPDPDQSRFYGKIAQWLHDDCCPKVR